MLSSTTGVPFQEQLESAKVIAASWCPGAGARSILKAFRKGPQDDATGDSHCVAVGGWAGRVSLCSGKKADGRMAG